MGLATAWALRRERRDVLVLEQFEVGHPHGSSHGTARIFRFAYSEPEWVALAQEALPIWRELEAESGTELLALTGLVDTGQDTGPLCAALEERSAEYELLSAEQAAERFGLRFDRDVVLELHGGMVWADKARGAFSAGLAVREGVRAIAIEPHDDGVVIETSAGPLHAGTAVVAAGAWATPLLAGAGIELTTKVTRETVAYFELPGVDDLPAIIDWNMVTGRHAYSLANDETTLKVGLHHSGTRADPDEPGEPSEAVVAEMSDWVGRRYPAANPEPMLAETCLYTSIEDDAFVIERHGSIIVCSACSGHGFKFAPAVGMRTAALAAS